MTSLPYARQHSEIPSKDLDVKASARHRQGDGQCAIIREKRRTVRMMKLSTMLKVDSTADTQWQSRIAEQMLEHWEHDQGSAQFFRSSTNFVYVFRKGGERSFLRFAESAERTGAAIEAEMALLCWVASKAMTVTTPIASKNGRCVEEVETDLGTFHAVVFAELQGSQGALEELSTAQFEVWGPHSGNCMP
jgi:Ser/Thr protein kinase RdoA (MazF antagonist)